MTTANAFGRTSPVVTITTVQEARSYPCHSLESATKLVERFIAGLSRRSPAKADVVKPRQPKKADQQPAEPVAEPVETAVAA